MRSSPTSGRTPTSSLLVDRLPRLAPPTASGWARHWLDVVHYGDSHGYDKDKRRDNAWRYRDYVIESFNEDRPYGRFVREQLAGDVLFPDRADAIEATGFIAAGPWDFVGQLELREGTVDKDKTRNLDRDDMVANTMSTFVSLTTHCARCHDHKFDPIPQKDYYRLQAVFAGVERGDRPTARYLELKRRRDEAADRLAAIERKAATLSSPELKQLDESIEALRRRLAEAPRPPTGPRSPTNGYHSGIAEVDTERAWVQVDLGQTFPIDAIRLVPARPVDFPDTPGFGFPTWFRVDVGDDPTFRKAFAVAQEVREEGVNQPDEPYVIRPEGRRARFVRVTAEKRWKRTNDYVFALAELEVLSGGRNVAAGAKVAALDSIEAGRWSTRALVDGFGSRARRPDPSDPREARRDDLLVELRDLSLRRGRLKEALIDPALQAEIFVAQQELLRAEVAVIELAGLRSDLAYAVLPRAPRPIHVLNRGEVEQPREVVGPGALSCLPGLESAFESTEDEGARRAALAGWVADPRNVLTWRSIVNRLWLGHFGRGIVETPNDFGRNGATPSHPELLDWLAVEFLDRGQSIKAMHRLIVTSAAYRQSSTDDAAWGRIDAENRFLWRQNRRRLDAESIRDATLAVSGGLDLRMGGPAYEPFRFKDDHSPIYDHEALDRIDAPETRRRTVYRFTVRSVPDPFLDSLDCADPNANVPVRNTTLTALQALALLNDPFMVRRSSAFAGRLEAESGDDLGAAIDRAYRLAFGRGPRPEEREALAGYARRHGLGNACRLLLNANEFVFVD